MSVFQGRLSAASLLSCKTMQERSTGWKPDYGVELIAGLCAATTRFLPERLAW